MHAYIFMFHLAPIMPYRADKIVLDLHEYVSQYKIDSIAAYTTIKRIIRNGTEMEWEALFSR
jgi:hypothetical protein